MKTVKILPSVNNFDFCGRVMRTPLVSENGNVMVFELIRNFGGDKKPVIVRFTMFKPKEGFPEFLKKGAPVIAHAYVTPNSWTDKDGNLHEEVQKVIKKVELAELVTKTLKDDEPIDLNIAEGVDVEVEGTEIKEG